LHEDNAQNAVSLTAAIPASGARPLEPRNTRNTRNTQPAGHTEFISHTRTQYKGLSGDPGVLLSAKIITRW